MKDASGNDHVDPARSRLMSRIKAKHTKPELIVRRLLHAMGHRFRLHKAGLPGTPDIVFATKRKAIFVHGCFWHRHPECHKTTMPKTRSEFWQAKFTSNVQRDQAAVNLLNALGWQTLIVWECETRDSASLKEMLGLFLTDPNEADVSG